MVGLSNRKAHEYSLVLSSRRIPHHHEQSLHGTDILVQESHYNAALNEIHLYLQENKTSTQPSKSALLSERFHRTYSGLFVSAMMFTIHVKLPQGPDRNALIKHYGSSASHVLDGEVYRLLTALFLHGDDAHLSGNIGGILLFGTAVAGLTGPGFGWFLILLSGIIGNGINAWFFQSHHLSIGSSTAIFGALGILAGLRSMRIFGERGLHPSSFLPLGAGFALLGLLGSSAHSDISAHLFGYLAGLVSGAVYARLMPAPPKETIQYLLLFLTALMVICAWYLHRPL